MKQQTLPGQGKRFESRDRKDTGGSAGSDHMALECHEEEADLFIHLAGKTTSMAPPWSFGI